MNWKRAIGYGIVLWAVPFLLSFLLFRLHESNRPLFESLITVTGVAVAVAGALLYFRDSAATGPRQGLMLGFGWAVLSIALDLPIFLGGFGMAPGDYAADIALCYLAFPAITIGIALARSGGAAKR
jgi:hypothetical protein